MSNTPWTAADLTRQLFLNQLPGSIQKVLRSHHVRISDSKISIRCQTRQGAAMLRNITYNELLYMAAATPLLQDVTYVRYEWADGLQSEPRAYELPLFFIEFKGLTWSRLDLSSVQILTDMEVIDAIYRYEAETGLPACCVDMASDRPLFASDSIHLTCRLPKSEFLALSSVAQCFSPSELADFKTKIIAARGNEIDVSCQAANLGDRQICHWQTRSSLIKTSWGRLARIVKISAMPEPTGAILGV